MKEYPGKLYHNVPSWVKPGAVYHIRIRCLRGSPVALTDTLIAPIFWTLFDSTTKRKVGSAIVSTHAGPYSRNNVILTTASFFKNCREVERVSKREIRSSMARELLRSPNQKR